MPRQLNFYAWYPGDYRAKTRHLTREEHFAFREIMDEIFMTDQDACRIADDDDYLRSLAKATPDEWAGIRKTLIDGPRALLKKHGRFIYSPRLTEEIEKAKVKSSKNSANAKARWSDRNADAMRTHSERTEVAMPVESESESEKSKKKTQPPASSSRDDDARENTEIVLRAVHLVAPHVRLTRRDAATWLRQYHPDPWCIAAALFEKQTYLASAKSVSYVAKLLLERKMMNGSGFAFDDARGYVEHMMQRHERANGGPSA